MTLQGPDHLSGELEAFFSDKAGVQVGVQVGDVGVSLPFSRHCCNHSCDGWRSLPRVNQCISMEGVSQTSRHLNL